MTAAKQCCAFEMTGPVPPAVALSLRVLSHRLHERLIGEDVDVVLRPGPQPGSQQGGRNWFWYSPPKSRNWWHDNLGEFAL